MAPLVFLLLSALGEGLFLLQKGPATPLPNPALALPCPEPSLQGSDPGLSGQGNPLLEQKPILHTVREHLHYQASHRGGISVHTLEQMPVARQEERRELVPRLAEKIQQLPHPDAQRSPSSQVSCLAGAPRSVLQARGPQVGPPVLLELRLLTHREGTQSDSPPQVHETVKHTVKHPALKVSETNTNACVRIPRNPLVTG